MILPTLFAIFISLLFFQSNTFACFFGRPTVKSPPANTSPASYNQLPNVAESGTILAPSCGHSKYWHVTNGYEATVDGTSFSKIIGGVSSMPNEFPFVALLAVHETQNSASPDIFCGAIVLNNLWILTAGHCVTEFSSGYAIFGEYDTLVDDSGEHERTIAEVILHPSFNSRSFDYDYALMKLSEPVDFTSWYVQPICLPDSCPLACKEGDMAYVAGWGSTSEAPKIQSNIIRKMKAPIVSMLNCALSESPHGIVTDRMICAGYDTTTVDACQGDSGGPLFTAKNGYYELCGVVSHGLGCAASDTFGVYSKVCIVRSWIKTVTGT